MHECGNAIVDPEEVCDGNNLGEASCEDFGFDGGTLICNSDCRSFNTAGCATSSCGNLELDPGEACDGDNLGGASCESLGFEGGTLACTASCQFDTSGCTNAATLSSTLRKCVTAII